MKAQLVEVRVEIAKEAMKKAEETDLRCSDPSCGYKAKYEEQRAKTRQRVKLWRAK